MICNARFFGCKTIPQIELTDDVLRKLADESVDKGVTVPGVQKKLSVHLSNESSPRLTLVGYPAGYILKPQSNEYPCLPECEDMVMDIADMMGIRTVPHGLIKSGDEWMYITKRVDRIEEKSGKVSMLAMEDCCQLAERLSENKYKSSYEVVKNIIQKYSTRPGIDVAEFYLRLVVCFLTGNSDMHLKNFSLIETSPGNRDFVLSPAYDLLAVNIVNPLDTEETALTLCGKKSKLSRKNFMQFAVDGKINEKAANNIIDSCLKKIDKAKKICDDSQLSDEMKDKFRCLIDERADRLS